MEVPRPAGQRRRAAVVTLRWLARINRLAGWAVTSAAVFVLAVFAALSFYAAPQADDFDYAVFLQRYGLLGSQFRWYEGWNGRYTLNAAYTIALGAVDPLTHYEVFPLACLLLMWTGVFLVLRSARDCPAAARWTTLWLAVYLLNAPAKAQVCFWLGGIVLYPLGNVCLALFGIPFLRIFSQRERAKRWRAVLVAAILAVLTIGSNETSMTITVFLVVLGVAASLLWNRSASPACLVLLAVSAAASSVVVAAPGNAVRSSFFPHANHLLSALMNSARQTCELLAQWSVDPLLIVVTLLSLRPLASIGTRVRRTHHVFRPLTFLWALVALGFLSVFVTVFPSWWSLGFGPMERTRNVAYVVFLWCWALTAAVAAAHLKWTRLARPRTVRLLGGTVLRVAVVLALLIHPWLASALDELRTSAPLFRNEVRERYQTIARARRQGVTALEVKRFGHRPRDLFVSDLISCAATWPNNSYAEFFGLEAIRVPGNPHACYPIPPQALKVVNPYSLHLFRSETTHAQPR
jgi:hypothetical protein